MVVFVWLVRISKQIKLIHCVQMYIVISEEKYENTLFKKIQIYLI